VRITVKHGTEMDVSASTERYIRGVYVLFDVDSDQQVTTLQAAPFSQFAA
jgi:hypothetical protein